MPHRAAYRPGRGRGKSQLPGQGAVCSRGTVGNGLQQLPDPALESGSLRSQRRKGREGELPGKIRGQPCLGLPERRIIRIFPGGLLHCAGIIFLSLQPKSGHGAAV